jgi:hypothetical protein
MRSVVAVVEDICSTEALPNCRARVRLPRRLHSCLKKTLCRFLFTLSLLAIRTLEQLSDTRCLIQNFFPVSSRCHQSTCLELPWLTVLIPIAIVELLLPTLILVLRIGAPQAPSFNRRIHPLWSGIVLSHLLVSIL